jgi:hypothetical protein
MSSSTMIRAIGFDGPTLVCHLTDGRTLRVPTAISPALDCATYNDRFQWQVVDDGRTVMWSSTGLNLRLSLRAMLDDPEATVDPEGIR